MKKIFFLFFIGINFISYSQKTLNNYKYVLVPKKFDFVKGENKYQLNELTKFLFEKSGFEVIYGDEIPEDYAQNNCLGLKADVESKSKFLTVKMIVELRDCKNNLVFASEIGKSKEKDFKKGYHEGLRNAFKSIEALNYQYEPILSETATSQVVASTVVAKEKKTSVSEAVIVSKKEPIVKEKKTQIKEKLTTISQPAQTIREDVARVNKDVLYAQPIENGYQLVDSTPKIIYILQKTSLQDVFLLKDKKGVFFKKGNDWVLEYYNENGQLVQEKVNAKF